MFLFLSPTAALGAIPTFPGAEGYGAEALSSCRNKPLEVKFVTNTNNAGAGSLRQVILDSDPNKFSVIVFRTGGTIKIPFTQESNKAIWLDGKDCIYIAGQTAPGGGIQLTGPQPEAPLQLPNLLSISSNDVVIRYMKFRQGMVQNVGEAGPLSVGGPEKGFRPNRNIILDHVSFAYPQDSVGVHGDPYTEGVTIQRCLLTGGINTLGGGTAFELGNAFHPRSEGPIRENVRKMSLHHCLFSSMSHRTPLIAAGKNYEVINSVIYNWGSRSVEIGTSKDGGDPARTPDIGIITADVINNYYKVGPSTGAKTDLLRTHGPPFNGDASVYVSGTVLDPGKPDPNTDSWTGYAKDDDDQQSPERFRRLIRLQDLPTFPVSIKSTQEAYNQLVEQGDAGAWQRLDCKGNWVANRDSLDQQAVDDVKRRTMAGRTDARYGHAVNEAFYGGYPVLDRGAPCADSDNDGMPNEFELKYALNPNDASDNARDADGDGYLNIEEYVNGENPASFTPTPTPGPQPPPQPPIFPPPPPPGPPGSDSTPPVISNVQPQGALPASTKEVVIALETNEPAQCGISQGPGVVSNPDAKLFPITGETFHSITIPGIEKGESYTLYAKCKDTAGNITPEDILIQFSIEKTKEQRGLQLSRLLSIVSIVVIILLGVGTIIFSLARKRKKNIS